MDEEEEKENLKDTTSLIIPLKQDETPVNPVDKQLVDNSEEFFWTMLRCRGGNEIRSIEAMKRHPNFDNYFKDNFIILRNYEKKSKSKGMNILSGYYLVEMVDCPTSRFILRNYGGTGVTKKYKNKEEVDVLLHTLQQQSEIRLNKNFSVNEEVLVKMGIINGEGTIISINEEKQTANVEISCFNSYTLITVPFENLEKKNRRS